MVKNTDNGLVMVISQILNGQYHIWDYICVRPAWQPKFFVGKTTKSIFPSTRDSKCQNICADSLAKNIKIYQPNLSAQAQKIGISLKKGFNGRPLSMVKNTLQFLLPEIPMPMFWAGIPKCGLFYLFKIKEGRQHQR